MLDNLEGKKVILASKSPRRQQLLKGLDIDFEIRLKEVEEIYPSDMPGTEVPEYLAELKFNAFIDELAQNEILITSDTVVLLGDRILEKPQSEEEAKQMIADMSGKTHTVVTGVCVGDLNDRKIFSNQTEVTFAQMSEDEIAYYIEKYKPYDKAGSYGCQEWIGYVAIENMNGSFYAVMGLPVHQVYAALKEF